MGTHGLGALSELHKDKGVIGAAQVFDTKLRHRLGSSDDVKNVFESIELYFSPAIYPPAPISSLQPPHFPFQLEPHENITANKLQSDFSELPMECICSEHSTLRLGWRRPRV